MRAFQRDHTVLTGQVHAGHGLRVGHELSFDWYAKFQTQPCAQHFQRQEVGLAGHLHGGDGQVRRLIEHRGEHCAPDGQSCPGQVDIFRCPIAAQTLNRGLRIIGVQRVGDATAGHRTHQILGRVRRRCGRPPRHYRRIRHKQRDNQRIRVVDKATARTQDDDLTGTGVRAESHLGVQVGIVRIVRAVGQIDGRIIATRAHLGGHFGRVRFAFAGLIGRIGIRYYGNHAARVLTAGRVRDFQRML